MRTANVEPLRDQLRSAITGNRQFKPHVEALVRAAEPYIVLDGPEDEADLSDLPLGASRFGGVPDLPPDLAWPEAEGRKIQFLAQIDFSELPRWEGCPLPADGWLYYFGLYENDHAMVTVARYHRGPRAALVRAPVPGEDEIWLNLDDEPIYELVPLKPRLGLTLDAVPLAAAIGVADPDRFASDLREFLEEAEIEEAPLEDLSRVGWLLGDLMWVDGSAREHAANFNLEGDDWMNLLTVLSAGSMEWGDCGMLYLLIRRSDLAKADFTHTEVAAGSA